jgi:hypothetical protein
MISFISIIGAITVSIILGKLIYDKYRIYNIEIKLTEPLSKVFNEAYKESATKAIDKLWPNLSLQERMDFIRYDAERIGMSWNQGILEASDIDNIREKVSFIKANGIVADYKRWRKNNK